MNVEVDVALDKFSLRWYQSEIWDTVEEQRSKRILYIAARRAGKDILFWNLAIRQCIKKTCLVFYVLPTYSQGRKAVFDAIAIDGTKFLDYLPKLLVESINQSEMKIRFKNDSILQVIGGDTYDTSLVGTNPYAVILSEYALMPPDIFSFIRPILAANKGWCAMLGCVAPETLVLMADGLKRIKDVSQSRDEYSDLNKSIYGIGGFHNADQFYYAGLQRTLKITLESGYELECTPIHPVWDGKQWVKSQDLKVGDLIPIQYGQDIWGNGLDISDFEYISNKAHKELVFDVHNMDHFYLLGLIHADGCYDNNKIRMTKKKDPEIIEFLHKYGFITRKDDIHHEYASRAFVLFLEYLGFKHGARNKTFPEKLLSCTKEQIKAFLQGLFDGDGCSHATRGTVKLTSTCKSFMSDLQVVLLNFGIASNLRKEEKVPTERVKVNSTIYNIEISGHFAYVFYNEIGFKLLRKQKNSSKLSLTVHKESGNVYPIDISQLDGYSLPKNIITNPSRITRRLIKYLNERKSHPYLQELLREKYYYSPIKEIVHSQSEVFDFVIPDTHSFFSNGYLSHNTPRGKNHMWQLWKIAQELPEWKIFVHKASDIHHIDEESLLKEREQMDEGLYLQEYECSFERGISGSYYGTYLDALKLKGQICSVPWEPGLLTYVAFDIGVNDATTIIFWQTVGDGTVIRIIDCYSNTGLGIDHYAKILQDKPYRYGKYFAPADIKVREWGGGAVTRYEKARQLGIDFSLIEQVTIVDGIENVWTHFSKFWIDQEKCRSLINALENYRKEWDEASQRYLPKPVKSWANHYADCLRYMCLAIHKTKRGMTAEEFERKKAQALYGNQGDLPRFFRNDPRYDNNNFR